jgi:hypothetical protein
VHDTGSFFPHDVGHAVGAGLVKKSIHLFVKYLLGTTGKKDLDDLMASFPYPPYFPSLPNVSHHHLQYTISQAVHWVTIAPFLLGLSFTETSVNKKTLKKLKKKGVVRNAEEVVDLVLDFFQTLAEAVALWFAPALEFPNDYLEMERLSFEVGEKMLRVSPSSLDPAQIHGSSESRLTLFELFHFPLLL